MSSLKELGEQVKYSHSSNGSVIGWWIDDVRKTELDGKKYRFYPAIAIHGGNDSKHRTRYFSGAVIVRDDRVVPVCFQWDFGMKKTETKDSFLEKEVSMFLTTFTNTWKGWNLGLFAEFLEKRVSGLYDILSQEAPVKEYPQERCVFRLKGMGEYFEEKLNQEQSLFQALYYAAKSAGMMTMRRQPDVLYRAYGLIKAKVAGGNFDLHQYHNLIQNTYDAKRVMADCERQLAKDLEKKGIKGEKLSNSSKGRNVR